MGSRMMQYAKINRAIAEAENLDQEDHDFCSSGDGVCTGGVFFSGFIAGLLVRKGVELSAMLVASGFSGPTPGHLLLARVLSFFATSFAVYVASTAKLMDRDCIGSFMPALGGTAVGGIISSLLFENLVFRQMAEYVLFPGCSTGVVALMAYLSRVEDDGMADEHENEESEGIDVLRHIPNAPAEYDPFNTVQALWLRTRIILGVSPDFSKDE